MEFPAVCCGRTFTAMQGLIPHLKKHERDGTRGIIPLPERTEAQIKDAARKREYTRLRNAGLLPPPAKGKQRLSRKAVRDIMEREAASRADPMLVAEAAVKAAKPVKAAPKYHPGEIADGVLHILYPDSVPLDQVRAVAEWMTLTDRLVAEALSRGE